MRIRWERIGGIVLLLFSIYLFNRLGPLLEDLLQIANTDDDYRNPIKALMLAVLCLTFLGGIKLLSNARKENQS